MTCSTATASLEDIAALSMSRSLHRLGVTNRRFNPTDPKEDRTMRKNLVCRCPGYGIVLFPLLFAGCTRAPTFDIMGSFFPAWLVCLLIGILLTAFARWLLLHQQIVVVWPVLVYPSLAALFTFLLWLIFFS